MAHGARCSGGLHLRSRRTRAGMNAHMQPRRLQSAASRALQLLHGQVLPCCAACAPHDEPFLLGRAGLGSTLLPCCRRAVEVGQRKGALYWLMSRSEAKETRCNDTKSASATESAAGLGAPS